MNITTTIALIIAIVAVAAAAWMFLQLRKTRKLRSRFGREYDRAVESEGGTRRAESVLEKRQERVEKYSIRELSRDDRDRFAAEWRGVQEHFVDDPRKVVADADRLIHEAMQARGYPMSDFEHEAADLSVHHPRVVEDYRIAHSVAVRDQRGQVTTEELRLAMQHYRSLFEDVVEIPVTRREVA